MHTARHWRPGDTVTVTTSATPSEALVEVADTGPGILVKEPVTAHGGTVTAASGPDGGARLTLRLPGPAPHGSRLGPGSVQAASCLSGKYP